MNKIFLLIIFSIFILVFIYWIFMDNFAQKFSYPSLKNKVLIVWRKKNANEKKVIKDKNTIINPFIQEAAYLSTETITINYWGNESISSMDGNLLSFEFKFSFNIGNCTEMLLEASNYFKDDLFNGELKRCGTKVFEETLRRVASRWNSDDILDNKEAFSDDLISYLDPALCAFGVEPKSLTFLKVTSQNGDKQNLKYIISIIEGKKK